VSGCLFSSGLNPDKRIRKIERKTEIPIDFIFKFLYNFNCSRYLVWRLVSLKILIGVAIVYYLPSEQVSCDFIEERLLYFLFVAMLRYGID
jgi:hypothetical protein